MNSKNSSFKCTMLDFAMQYLKIGVTNNQSFAYHFVGNLLLYRKQVPSATAAAS